MDIDKLFGSHKFKIGADEQLLRASAKKILEKPIVAATFDHRAFLKHSTDLIAIEKGLCDRMRAKFLSN